MSSIVLDGVPYMERVVRFALAYGLEHPWRAVLGLLAGSFTLLVLSLTLYLFSRGLFVPFQHLPGKLYQYSGSHSDTHRPAVGSLVLWQPNDDHDPTQRISL